MMDLAQLLDVLGYSSSPSFLPVAEMEGSLDLSAVPDYGHIFRQAASEPCSLQGVYSLRPWTEGHVRPVVPVVYVCKARTRDEADAIHRLVWNQDVVPFLFVHTPLEIRLYSGFRYDGTRQGTARGVLRVLRDFTEVQDVAEGFHAESIDQGRIWRVFGEEVKPDQRVDWKLLRNLRALDDWLQKKGGLEKDLSHALIGKYVYFHYLRDRNILSERKLESWGLRESDVFGRKARLTLVAKLANHLETWLNGEIFPIDFKGGRSLSQEHLSWVAGIFAGDEVGESGTRQLSLDFLAYDFSYIPIETLSVIYEQFLHTSDEDDEAKTKGKEVGAYYTPLPLVNFMLTEMEDHLPLEKGTTIFDPSCGSGAFLVQCYRRLVEKEMMVAGRKLRPRELRDLLEKHIYGVDRDPDACSITELSLILTLLGYVEPPDLESNPTFQLPALRGKNVFHVDFFDDTAPWSRQLQGSERVWVVGNPPWKKLNPGDLAENDQLAWTWMTEKSDLPVGGNQVAQGFAWRVLEYLPANASAYVGLLLPAMTLFEAHSRKFRAKFFEVTKVESVANLANLAEVLFGGRSRVPAAALFFQPRGRTNNEGAISSVETIAAYSPLVANQEATKPTSEKTRNESWSLVVNASEVRNLPRKEVLEGDGLPWKLAAWGSQLDVRLLSKLKSNFKAFDELERDGMLVLSQGPELRKRHVTSGPEKTKYCEEVVGKKKLDMNLLKKCWRIFCFPNGAFKDNRNHFLRRGAAEGLEVCRPPHVIVNAARRFAVYSNEYLIIPSRQIGIASTTGDKLLLKALSLYLSSDFAFYHQFLTSSQFGVKRDVATLAALRAMPIPFLRLSRSELKEWGQLHTKLIEASRDEVATTAQASLFDEIRGNVHKLIEDLNEMTYDALGLTSRERALVHDLVRIRLELNDGKLGKPAVRPPEREEIREYARLLKQELDSFVGSTLDRKHKVEVVYDELSGMIEVDLTNGAKNARKITVAEADAPTTSALAETRLRLLVERSQWVYFNRNLRVYEGSRTFVFKPMQRFHWTESQALLDAREIIAETLSGGVVS